MKIKPHKIQRQALKKLKSSNKKINLVVMPSGIGKTYLAAFFTKMSKQYKRILFLAHRKEIIIQARDTFCACQGIGTLDTSCYFAKRHDSFDSKYVFASVMSLCRDTRLHSLPKNHFDLIIVDEYHHSAARSYGKILDYFTYKKLIGLTATPYRYDSKDLYKKPTAVYETDVYTCIKDGFLSKFKYFGIWDNVDYSKIKWDNKQYSAKDLDKVLIVKDRNKKILELYQKNFKKRKTLAFCCSVRHVHRMIRTFGDAGIKCAAITYETPSKQREAILKAFQEGRIEILFTKDIFNEGVDIPACDGILLLRPTFSKTIFWQQLGRGLRTHPGKRKTLVYDLIGNHVNAYKTFSWLAKDTPLTTDYKKRLKDHLEIDIDIHFDKEVIDIFQRTAKPSKESLAEDYYRVKKLIGKAPHVRQYEKYGRYARDWFNKFYGSWGQFKVSINDNNKNYTREQVLHLYKEFYKKEKYLPTVRECRKTGLPSDNTVRKLFGSYGTLIKEAGATRFVHEKNKVTSKAQMIKDLKALRKKLGKVPFARELNQLPYCFQNYAKKFWGHAVYIDIITELGWAKAYASRFKYDRDNSKSNTMKKIWDMKKGRR